MFTPESFVDNVQDAKLAVIRNMPVDEKLKTHLFDYVETQRTFVQTNVKIARALTERLFDPKTYTSFYPFTAK